MKNKEITRVDLYTKYEINGYFPVYPISPLGSKVSALSWSNDGVENFLSVPNLFHEINIIAIETRMHSSEVFKVTVPFKTKNNELKHMYIDLKPYSLLNIMEKYDVIKGKIVGNFHFDMTSSSKYLKVASDEYVSNFNKLDEEFQKILGINKNKPKNEIAKGSLYTGVFNKLVKNELEYAIYIPLNKRDKFSNNRRNSLIVLRISNTNIDNLSDNLDFLIDNPTELLNNTNMCKKFSMSFHKELEYSDLNEKVDKLRDSLILKYNELLDLCFEHLEKEDIPNKEFLELFDLVYNLYQNIMYTSMQDKMISSDNKIDKIMNKILYQKGYSKYSLADKENLKIYSEINRN